MPMMTTHGLVTLVLFKTSTLGLLSNVQLLQHTSAKQSMDLQHATATAALQAPLHTVLQATWCLCRAPPQTLLLACLSTRALHRSTCEPASNNSSTRNNSTNNKVAPQPATTHSESPTLAGQRPRQLDVLALLQQPSLAAANKRNPGAQQHQHSRPPAHDSAPPQHQPTADACTVAPAGAAPLGAACHAATPPRPTSLGTAVTPSLPGRGATTRPLPSSPPALALGSAPPLPSPRAPQAAPRPPVVAPSMPSCVASWVHTPKDRVVAHHPPQHRPLGS